MIEVGVAIMLCFVGCGLAYGLALGIPMICVVIMKKLMEENVDDLGNV